MRRGAAIGMGSAIGAVVGAVVLFFGVLVYFIATGNSGPNGLGIAVVLSLFAGTLGLLFGAVGGGLVTAAATRG